jgi:shikimate dehydrogenase
MVRTMGAANTLIVGGRGQRKIIRAENTDGYGLVTALGDLGIAVAPGQVFVLVGAGGAAAGGLAALVGAGAEVRLVARRPSAARGLRERFAARARARISLSSWTPERLERALDGATALVSAGPAFAWAEPAAAAGIKGLGRSTAVLEMAYGEATPLSALARRRSSRYQDGLPMLVHQAARAVELVVGRLPPAVPLLKAARRPAGARSAPAAQISR